MNRGIAALAAVIVVLTVPVVWADDAPADAALEFVRVVVPPTRLPDVPLDGGRLVPMPLADFDRAVEALASASEDRGPKPPASAARYRLSLDDRGRLVGTLEFDVDATAAAVTGAVPLGRLRAEGAVLRAADGVGEAVLFGMPDGRVAIRTPVAGTYACNVTIPPRSGSEFSVPLVSALTTRLDLRMPGTVRPSCGAPGGGAVVVAPPAGAADAWRIDFAGGGVLDLALVPREARQPRVRCWTRVAIRGRQVDLAARIVPEGPWRAGSLALRKDRNLQVVQVRVAGLAIDADSASDATRCVLDVPARVAGTTTPIDVLGVATAVIDEPFAVPWIGPPADRWTGGGLTLATDPAFAIAALRLEECVVVAPAAGERWPAPEAAPEIRGDAATVHVEQQSAAARATVTIARRMPRLETSRVTTLELSPGAVLGRAACDVQVRSGEAFVITGRVAPEWFIDSVEAVEWPAGTAVDRAVDWRVSRAANAEELRIDLAEAATPSRPLGLRITGHRRGVPLGGEFLPADLDMVRLEGETADSALVDYRVGPDAVVEIGGDPLRVLPADGRLAPLVEPGSTRGRLTGGDGGAGGVARLVRRRPPLEAEVTVQVVARDARITESLSCACRPETGTVDSVVVTVSEPLGDAVEWSLVEPASGAIYARRLEAAGGGDRPQPERESWMVEFRPALEGPVTFRATRTHPFIAPVAVPLAWVEGATVARGTVVVRGAGGTRPGVVNRGLSERPPSILDDRSAAVVTELSYGPPVDAAGWGGEPPAVVVVPTDAAESRAWVWRQITTAWCHDSGWIECESEFDIENRGRSDVVLTVPAGLRLDQVTIDGEPAAFDGVPDAGGTTRVLLPTGRGRLRLHVRGVAARNPAWGGWRIDPVACAVDVPLLDRTLRLRMPADLELFTPLRVDAGEDWVGRLFDATVARPGRSANAAAGGEAGFRELELPPGSVERRGIYAIRRRLVSSASIIAAVAWAAVAWSLARWRSRVAVTVVVGLALAALWTPHPLATVARAAWWGGLAGLWWGAAGTRRHARAAAAVLVATLAVPARVDGAEPATPYRVFVTAGADGGTALVPEPLFRRLTAESAGRESIRVRRSRLLVSPGGPWRLELDVDADRGGVLNLDQVDADVRWRAVAAPQSVTVEVSPDGAAARVVAIAAGLHRVTIELVPHPVAAGAVERVAVRLPPAAATLVEADGATVLDGWQCDRDDGDGAWRPVPPVDGTFDASRAVRLRLVRSTDPGHPLAALPEEAQSLNEIWWGEDACVVNASFDVAAGRRIVRSLVIRADQPLEPVAGDAGRGLMALGGGRYLVDLPDPVAGRVQFAATFAMSLDDPTGVFDVPRVWLDAVAADGRTVRCSAAAGLDVAAELPAGFALLRPREGDPVQAVAWRSEVVAGSAASAEASGATVGAPDGTRPRLAVRRRPLPPRFVQRLDVAFSEDHVDLGLDCQIDSRSGPFTGLTIEVPADATIERVTLIDEGGIVDTVDMHVSRPAATKLLVVTQRPQPGIYRLALAARVAGLHGSDGRLPVARCTTTDGPPLAVRWRARPGIGVVVRGPGGPAAEGAGQAFDLAAGDVAPEVTVEPSVDLPDRARDSAGPPPREPVTTASLDESVEATLAYLTVDAGGRLWGLARFEVVAADQVVRLRLPPGLRLYDVLVDGRETRASAVDATAWDVRLHDVRWPRSIVAVFAGDLSMPVDAWGAVRIEPPRIEGLPCREVLWTIDAPADIRLLVAEPARVATAAEWRAARDGVRGRVAAAFAAAAESVPEPDRARLREFAEAREAGAHPALESEWTRVSQGSPPAGWARVHVVEGGRDGVTIRTTRPGASAAGGRELATLALVATLVAGWLAAAWQPAAWSGGVSLLWPWLIAVAGGAWVMLLRPTLPGWALAAAGAVSIMARRRAADAPPTPPASAGPRD